MQNERNLMELCERLGQELADYIEGVTPLYPGSGERIEALSRKIEKMISRLKAEGGERLLATAKYLEGQMQRINDVLKEYIEEKAKEN